MSPRAASPFTDQFDPATVITVDGTPLRTRNALTRRSGDRLRLPPIGTATAAAASVTDTVGEDTAPTRTEAELAAAVEEARREAAAVADAAARAEMQAAVASRQAEALTRVAALLADARADHAACLEAQARTARDLGLALGRAIVPRALARAPLADLEAMLVDLVPRLDEQPWLELRLPPDLVEGGRAALARVAEENGYDGALEVVADAGLGDGDARLRWRHGSAERDLARLRAEAEALVEAWLPAGEDAPDAERSTSDDDGADATSGRGRDER